jgi:hypothetical protein
MARIEVRPSGEAFEVVVTEGAGESRHLVTVSEDDLARLGGGYAAPEEFIRACFEFLLAREPKESILARFDVSAISRYFPEFEDEIRR